MVYDVIIIGSGSAGAVVAERVSDGTPDCQPSVLLLEAGVDQGNRPYDASGLGTPPPDPASALGRKTSVRANATQQKSDESQILHWQHFDNSGIHHDVGKILGGSGAHNGMMSYRGTRLAHDRWPTGWKYDDWRPFYDAVDQRMHIVPRQRITMDPAALAFEQSALNLGYDGISNFNASVDANPTYSGGVGPTTANLKGMAPPNINGTVDKYGEHQTVFETYLEDIRDRPNITIQTFAEVQEVNHERTGRRRRRATSVRYLNTQTGVEHTVEGNLVVLCCGAIGSPALLFRSNIGPRPIASSSNQHVRMRKVGKNYNAHPFATIGVVFNEPIFARWGYEVPITLQRDYDSLDDALSMGVFNYNKPDLGAATLDWGHSFKNFVRDIQKWQFGFSWPIFPTTRGRIKFDPDGENTVEVYYPELTEHDTDLMQAGLDETIRVYQNFACINTSLRIENVFPVPGYGLNHGIGTCAMGQSRANSVVRHDNLMVHGFENLMVVDASVFPHHLSSSEHANISTLALKISETHIRPLLGLPQTISAV